LASSAVIAIALLAAGPAPSGNTAAQTTTAVESTHATLEFSERVLKYAKLHQKMEKSLRSLKPTKDSASIDENKHALAKKIVAARPDAKQGDIFTADVTAQFRRLLAQEFHGPDESAAHKTIKQGEPVKAVTLQVNSSYPDGVPVTTVPPSLLQKLPPVPRQVEYRIIDRYLVLLDVRASLIVDFIDRAIPSQDAK